MAWRDQLQPASFRGVPFEYLADDLGGIGRRNQLHEYPKRDQSYVEDMGRGAESIDIEARLVGADYLKQLENLLAALRAPGPGELVHPFYGRLQVIANPACRVRHSMEDGGLCSLSLSFTEAGENKYPTSEEVPSLQVESWADELVEISTTSFAELFSVVELPEWVSTEALADIEKVMGAARTIYGRVMGAQWTDLLGNAGGLATALLGMIPSFGGSAGGGSGGGGSSGGGKQPALQAARMFSRTPRPGNTTALSSKARRQVLTNRRAVLDLVTRGSIAQAAREIVAVDSPVFDDLMQWRDELTAVVDREVERPAVKQAEFEALAEVRAAVGQYVASEAITASRLRSYTPPTTLPAVLLAYDLYGDSSRSSELVSRNGVRHPSFVPPDPLKVLTE
jgi:prophage DNA circulation protein